MNELVMKVDHKLIRELMESDPEFKIEVKKGIIRSALRSYTNNLLEDVGKIEIKKMIQEEIGEISGWGSNRRIHVAPALINLLNEQMLEEVKKVQKRIAKETFDSFEQDIDKYITGLIETMLKEKVEAMVEQEIRARIEKAFQGGV